jgi:hypothetical protein
MSSVRVFHSPYTEPIIVLVSSPGGNLHPHVNSRIQPNKTKGMGKKNSLPLLKQLIQNPQNLRKVLKLSLPQFHFQT